MQKIKILILEDDEDIADLIKMHAEMAGYQVAMEHDGLNGLLAVEREKPDLVVLDVMLPGLNGLDVCRKIKANAKTQAIPVIIISAKSEEIDVVCGLEIGADDYVCKPFSIKILFSRIRAVLRRLLEPSSPSQTITCGQFTLDLENYLLYKNGKPIALTLTEFSILKALFMNRGKVLTRFQLLDDIPNTDADIIDRNIDVHIAALRRKLGSQSSGIQTVRGIGYRFVPEE